MSSKEVDSNDFMKLVIAGGLGVFTLAIYIICVCLKSDTKKEDKKEEKNEEKIAKKKSEKKKNKNKNKKKEKFNKECEKNE